MKNFLKIWLVMIGIITIASLFTIVIVNTLIFLEKYVSAELSGTLVFLVVSGLAAAFLSLIEDKEESAE